MEAYLCKDQQMSRSSELKNTYVRRRRMDRLKLLDIPINATFQDTNPGTYEHGQFNNLREEELLNIKAN